MRKKITINKKETKTKLIILFFIAIVLAASCFFYQPIENALGIGEVAASGQFVDIEVVNSSDMVVHYIDVKQADCTFIELPDGTTMLIDSGDKATADDVVKYIQAVLGTSKTIDYFVLTHSDSDHVGGAAKVFDAFEIKNIYRPFALAGTCPKDKKNTTANFVCAEIEDLSAAYEFMLSNEILKDNAEDYPRIVTETYLEVVDKIYAERYNGNSLRPNITVNYDGITISSTDADKPFEIEFYAPLVVNSDITLTYMGATSTQGYATKAYGATTSTGKNAISPVIRLEYLGNKFLFTGDIYNTAEKNVVDNLSNSDREDLADITVYQAGHHGASNSNSEEFLNVITPKYTVVSSNNEGNDYEHPSEEFLERIANLPHDITDYLLRTDQQGTIVFGVSNVGDIAYSTNVQITYPVFELRWWQIAVGLFVVSAVVLFNVKYVNKSTKKSSKKTTKTTYSYAKRR